ncbi:hypothetical protein BDR26DRAFT_862106 [Obelidium mucronatum]|nr:hypothetical protein BDR26DRAFT_862106 [Obelidium mucronatum]
MRVQVLAAKQPNHHRQKMLKQHVPERFLAALPVTADNSVPNQINGGNNIFNDPSLLPTNSTHPLMTPEIQARIQMLQTCRQASALPSTDALKARMHVIAALNSVEIDQECVAFLEQALSSYLKDIITSVQERVRQRQCELAMAAEGHSVHNSNNLMAGGRSMPATPGGTGTGNSNNTQNNHQNNGSNYDAGATDDMDKPETGENGGGSQPHKSEAISLSDLMLSSDITPILLKRSPGSVDTIEQLLANL